MQSGDTQAQNGLGDIVGNRHIRRLIEINLAPTNLNTDSSFNLQQGSPQKHAPGCFHCALPIPPGSDFGATVAGKRQAMCCTGCAAVAQAIDKAGLAHYYEQRTANAPTAQDSVSKALQTLAVFDHPAVQRSFVQGTNTTKREAALILEGISCAACVWLNEQHLRALPGVLDVQVNYATHRARIRWNEKQIRLSEIMRAIREIGYEAHPYDPGRQQRLLDAERRQMLKRLAVAGALGMQVMILAVALYTGSWSGIEERYRDFFQKLSLLLTLPVLLYSARPFFTSAWRDITNRRAGMDLPVALGITLAFSASTLATASGSGEVYFDSVCMFVFLLLGARTLELTARKRAADAADVIGQVRPASAHRLDASGALDLVPAVELVPGDKVLVRPGQTIPADGLVHEGISSVDEAILTGESLPQLRRKGDAVIGASLNIESPLTIKITHTGVDSVLSQIQQLLDRALIAKPRISQLADRVAGFFVLAILAIAAVVGLIWWNLGSTQWLAITVSVLVVSCPCALSLATPAAVTATVGGLMRQGVLLTRAHALETLAHINTVIFDKTGTLTHGQLQLVDVDTAQGLDREQALILAAALERYSEHPLAQAISRTIGSQELPQALAVVSEPGGGVFGRVGDEALFVGSPDFVRIKTGLASSECIDCSNTTVVLANTTRILATFSFKDRLRRQAPELITRLKALGLNLVILSGDQIEPVKAVADELQIANAKAKLAPADKLEQLQQRQQNGETVAVVGDGVNDAPVLAGADVSIAVARASPLAAATADVVILNDDIRTVAKAIHAGRRTLALIRQNLAWALAYNLLAVPAAALGYVPPWLAAIGMSASSLIVVANTLRLR